MKNMLKAFGFIALAAIIGFSFAACSDGGDDGGGDKKPEDKPVAERWWKWTDSTATATIAYTVATDGVVTATVGGTAQLNNESDGWGKWKVMIGYDYTGKAGKSYRYTFEAWTQSGARVLDVQYYYNKETSTEIFLRETNLSITTTRTTYTITGNILPEGGVSNMQFLCADQLGTFYVKVISIEEVSSGSSGGNGSLGSTLTITNAQVYTENNNGTFSVFNGMVSGLNYVEYWDDNNDTSSIRALNELIEGSPSVTLTDGKLNVTIGTPKASSLQPFLDIFDTSSIPAGVTVSTSNVKFLILQDGFCNNNNTAAVIQQGGNSQVTYIYVDKDVNVNGRETIPDGEGGTDTFIYAMNLKAGWNSVIFTMNSTPPYVTNLQTGTPPANVRWVYYQ